jgi:hypothetical protein
MARKGHIDFPGHRTDRLESTIMAETETETSNEEILRTRLDMQHVPPLISRTLAPAID